MTVAPYVSFWGADSASSFHISVRYVSVLIYALTCICYLSLFFFFLDSSHPTEDEEESHVVLICFSLCPMRVSPTSLLLCLVTRAV